MTWLLLLLAAAFEVAFALLLKPSAGFTRLLPTAGVVVCGVVSVYLLSRTLTVLPVGTAYAAWTGIGSVGVVVLGMAFFHEPVTVLRVGCILLVVVGVLGLRLAGEA